MKKYGVFAAIFACTLVLSGCIGTSNTSDNSYPSSEEVSESTSTGGSTSTGDSTSTSREQNYEPGDNGKDETLLTIDGIEYVSYNVTENNDGTYTINQSGYLNLYKPLYDLVKIQVDYESQSDLSRIYYKTNYDYIDNPHNGNIALEDNVSVTVNDLTQQNYFSIYVAIGEYKIIDITTDNRATSLEEATLPTDIDLYAFNDFHGYVTEDSGGIVGMSRFGKYLKDQAQANKEGTIILSAGDNYQGTADSNLTRGALMNSFFNDFGLDATAVGNHEFDWGTSTLRTMIDGSNAPYLGLNIYDKTTNKMVDYVQASTMLVKNNVKVGVIGAVGDIFKDIAETVTDNENFYFILNNQLISLVRSEAEKLREEGAQIVIYVVHDDYNNSGSKIYQESLADVIDVVIEGHSHTLYTFKDNGGIYHAQARCYSRYINHIKFTLNNGKYGVSAVNSIEMSTKTATDSGLEDIYNYYYENYIKAIKEEELGTLSYSTNEYSTFTQPLYTVLQDYANNWLETNGYSGEEAIGFVIQSNLRTYISSGTITFGDLYQAMPFDNDVGLVSISGSNLLRRFVNSSYKATYMTVDPSQIDSSSTYYVLTESYEYGYSSNNMTLVKRFSMSELKAYDSTYYADLKSDLGVDNVYVRNLARIAFLKGLI